MFRFWPLLLLVAASSDAAVVGEWRVYLYRDTTTIQPASTGATEAAAWAACLARIPQTAPSTQLYTCQTPRYVATVTAGTTPTCTIPRPAAESRPGVCPGATAGIWQQVRNYTSSAYPVCWTAGAWLPATPPAGVCVATAPPGIVTLPWAPPTKNTDGSPLTDLASYKLYYGRSITAITTMVAIPAPATMHTLTGLTPGPLFARMTAINSKGRESAASNLWSVTVP